ncbi:hypothetical protein [Pelagerythrobacter sp.]|uniref:hypothetical protein n=1 Tax=Pelagerythrobacter sp. TaxID=2800702 RepID=UPI0035B2A366
MRFASVPRIGEGIRLREPDGCWASYDVLDVWYQKAEFGDVWMPYLHVCMTPEEQAVTPPAQPQPVDAAAPTPIHVAIGGPRLAAVRAPVLGEDEEVSSFTG